MTRHTEVQDLHSSPHGHLASILAKALTCAEGRALGALPLLPCVVGACGEMERVRFRGQLSSRWISGGLWAERFLERDDNRDRVGFSPCSRLSVLRS